MRTTKLIVTAMLAAAMCSGQAWGATIESAVSGYWTNGATWVGGTPPGSGDEAVITNGCTVTMNDLVTRSVSNLTIQAGGVLTHTANSSSEAYKCILSIVSNLTIEAGGKIDVDGRGYSAGGPGAGSGGGYGGKGGEIPTWVQTPGTTYGLITAPTNCGSRASNGTSGGGAVILTVGGTAAVNGLISAGGVDAANYYAGSGGSVFLTTGRLTGTGTLRANGGQAPSGAAGGGGRIAVILKASTDFGGVTMTAFGGVSSSGGAGGGGTIYLEKQGDAAGRGKLIVDYGSIAPYDRLKSATLQNGTAASSYEFSEIVLTNGALYMLDSSDALAITNTIVRGSPLDRFDGIYVDGGALTVSAAFSFTNYSIGIGANSTFNPTISLTVGNLASLIVDKPHTLNVPVTVAPGGILTHTANATTEANRMDLTVNGALDIQAGGEINVDGRGYARGAGPGLSTAGAHGGQGGMIWDNQYVGRTYGSITSSTNCGSGSDNGGAGGGAVRLNVTGTTTVSGMVSANGNVTGGNYCGSGGSVFITTGSLSGSGTVRANGGEGSASGGGGRIAVILTNSTDFAAVAMQAFGGYYSAQISRGSAGTVYRQHKNQAPGYGVLTVDNNNRTTEAFSTTLIGPLVTDREVGTVIVTNAAKLAISNQTLTVQGDWIIASGASFTAMTNSTVDFAGTNTATIYTNNTFYNLTATNAGKTLSFEAGRTNTVNGLLKLGALQSGQMVTLQSTVGGSWSYLTLVPGGTQVIARVNVKDNNASGGQLLMAGGGSANGGNNINWQFPPSGTMFMVK